MLAEIEMEKYFLSSQNKFFVTLKEERKESVDFD